MRLENLFRRVNDPDYIYGSDMVLTDVNGLPYIKPSNEVLKPIPFDESHPGKGVMFHSMDSLGEKNITHNLVQFVIHDGFVVQRQYATFSRYPFFWHGNLANALLICRTHLMTCREYLQKDELDYRSWAESIIAVPSNEVKLAHPQWYENQKIKFRGEDQIKMWQHVPKDHFHGYLFFKNEEDAERYDRTAANIATRYKNGLIAEKEAIRSFLLRMKHVTVYRIDGTVMGKSEKEEVLTSYICACLESQLLESAFDQSVHPEKLANIRPEYIWTIAFQHMALRELAS